MLTSLSLRLLPERLAVARLDAADPVPAWAFAGDTLAVVSRDGHELSIICAEAHVPGDVTAWRDLRALEVEGPLDFETTGVMASLAVPLADVGVWILALATYDTDVVLVKASQLDEAIAALAAAGHRVSRLT